MGILSSFRPTKNATDPFLLLYQLPSLQLLPRSFLTMPSSLALSLPNDVWTRIIDYGRIHFIHRDVYTTLMDAEEGSSGGRDDSRLHVLARCSLVCRRFAVSVIHQSSRPSVHTLTEPPLRLFLGAVSLRALRVRPSQVCELPRLLSRPRPSRLHLSRHSSPRFDGQGPSLLP